MAKSKKSAPSKKAKEEVTDVEPAAEDSTDVKVEENDEQSTQENGEVDVNLKKKAKKGKKEEPGSEEETKDEEEEEPSQENGDEDLTEKKKAPAKKKTPKKTPAKPAEEPSRKSSRTPKPVAKESSEEEAYEVEKLVDFRLQRGKPQFLVRWKGYSKDDDTWEDEAGLNCPELLQKYKEENPGAGKKDKKRAASKSPDKTSKKAKTKKPEKDYEVEEIVGMRVKNGKKEFKIRWKGYKSSDDSWEPEKHLSCGDLIEEYLEKHKDAQVDSTEEKKTHVKKEKASTKSSKAKKAKKN